MAKQQSLPDMENRNLPELEDAADDYRAQRDARMAALVLEKSAKSLLMSLMKKYGRTSYLYNGYRIKYATETKETVKVRTDKEEKKGRTMGRRKGGAPEPHVDGPTTTYYPKESPAAEPSAEESQANVLAFFTNPEANAEVAEVVAAYATDEFTAPRCAECKGIDGGHALGCSKSNGLTLADYLAYAKFNRVKNAASWARKWQITREKDGLILAWKNEGVDKARARITKPKAPLKSTLQGKPVRKGGNRR